jgi:hypothetical protein
MKRFCMTGLLALAASAFAQPVATLSDSDRRALDRAAALGVGLLEEGRRTPAPAAPRCAEEHPRTRPDGTLITMSKQAYRDMLAAERARCASSHDQFAREQNQRTGERLQLKYDAAVARCGGPLPVLPSVGMTLQRVFDCTQAGHFSGVDQIVELRLDGRRLQLYISQRSDVGRLYFVDGVLLRMDP